MKTKETQDPCKNVPVDRWEHGSDFHWPVLDPADAAAPHPWADRAVSFFGSGRDALRALLEHGAAALGWKRVFIPSYFCQEVAAALRVPGVALKAYSDAPGEEPSWPSDLGKSDAVLVVNFFGLRAGVDSSQIQNSCAVIVEDHTHDPWSPWTRSSRADFCVASLRKTLPVPEGGVVWSPRGKALPEEPSVTDERQRAADAKRSAMLLKSRYLSGQYVAKDEFRALFLEGESHIASGPVSGMTPATRETLDCFPVAAWREKRRENFEYLSSAIAGIPWLRVLQPQDESRTPMSAVIAVDTPARRESVRQKLIEKRIYPAVHWSLEEPVVRGSVPAAHVELSRRILSIHCDARYDESDLSRVAHELTTVP
jgi:hypothetical protein